MVQGLFNSGNIGNLIFQTIHFLGQVALNTNDASRHFDNPMIEQTPGQTFADDAVKNTTTTTTTTSTTAESGLFGGMGGMFMMMMLFMLMSNLGGKK